MKKFSHFSEQIFRLRLPRIILLGGILLIISTVVSWGQTGNIPDAVDDNPSTLEDTSLESNVSSNDTQAEGTNVWTLVTNVEHGELTFNSDGTYNYIPDLDYNGTDNFTYRLCDGDSDCDEAEVRITITAVNDMPSFVGGENQSINEDSGTQTIIGWATGIDDGDPDVAQVPGFNVFNDNPGLFSAQPAISTDGTLTYTSASDAFGSATVTVTLTDDDLAGGLALTTAGQNFTITINPLADTPAVSNAATNEDTRTTSGLVIYRNVHDGAEVTYYRISNIQNGTVYLFNGVTSVANDSYITAAQGTAGLKFTPFLNSTLIGSFNVEADVDNTSTNGLSGTATATITVAAVNDGPINTIPVAQTVAEGATLVFSAGNGNAISVSDIDVAETVNGTLQIALSVSNGLLTLSQVTGLTFETGDGTADDAMTIRGLPANLNAALSGMQFMGYPEDFNGDALLTILTMDLGQTGSGGAKVDQDDISIDVVSSNDAPTLTSVSTLTGGAEDTDFTITYATLLAAADEADIDGDPIFFRIEAVSSGTLTKEGIAVVPGTTLLGSGEALEWTPALNSNGVLDAFTVKAWDGLLVSADPSVLVRVEVTGVNDAPVITEGESALVPCDEDSSPLAFALVLNATDIEGNTLTWSVTTTAGHGTANAAGTGSLQIVSYTPITNYNGTDLFVVTVSDSNGGTDNITVNVTISAVNDEPISTYPVVQAIQEGSTLVFSAANGNEISVSDIDVAETLNGELSIHLTAAHGAMTLGQVTGLSFTQGDGTDDTEVIFSGLPADLNDALSGLQFRGYPEDFNTPTGGVAVLTIITSDLGNTGSGGPKTSTNTIDINISRVNDGPINTIPVAQTVEEGATLVFSAGNGNAISVSDIDVAETVNGNLQMELSVTNGLLTLSQVTGLTFITGDGDADAAITIRGLPLHLNAALSGLQFIGYPEDFNGEALFTIRTSDLANTGSGGTKVDQDVIFIDVISSNDAPTLTSVSTLTGGTEDTDFTITYATLLAAADEADVDGDPLSFRIETVSSGTMTKGGIAVVPGTTLLGSGESLVWTPALNSNGVLDAFTVKVWDGLLVSADPSVQVRVEVTGVNDAPVVTDIPNQTIPEGSTFTTINLDNYVTDVDNIVTEISWEATGTTDLTVVIVDRVATISTPSADWNGSETNTFTATDPGFLSDSNDAVFTVTDVIDLPPGWEVNPPDFDHSGQITAKVYINGSAVESGFLAAFVGEECRGITDTAYFPPSDHYVFGLMVYGNNAVGDTLTFKYYDPVEDKIYKMDTSFVFIPDIILGNAVEPKLMYEGIDYNNSLKVGWNWFSVNARYDNMNLNSVLSSCAMQDDYIKSQDSTATFYTGFGWWGSLDKLSPRDLYKVRVANPCGIKFLGRPIDVSTEVVNIVPGWNWIGYYPQSSLPISDALASLTMTQLDNIKSQQEVSTYYDGYGWFGDLDSLKPTEGYMIKVTLPGTLTYPEIPELKSATVYQEKDKTEFCPDRFEFSGTITAKVVMDGEQDRYEGNLLLAIVNNEIRGVVESHYFAPLDAWFYPLMIHSNLAEGEIVHFRFYDSRNDKFYSCEETLTFKNDMIVADAFKAFELNVKSGLGINDPELEDGLELKSYPNPFNMALNIEYQIKEQAHIILTIYDISGKIIDIPVDQLQDPDSYIIRWNSSMQPAGTYIIKLNAGEKQIIRKVSLVR